MEFPIERIAIFISVLAFMFFIGSRLNRVFQCGPSGYVFIPSKRKNRTELQKKCEAEKKCLLPLDALAVAFLDDHISCTARNSWSIGFVAHNPALSRGPITVLLRTSSNKAASVGYGFQLDLVIALSGSSSEGSAPSGFISPAEDALKRRVT